MAFARESKTRKLLVSLFKGVGVEVGVQEGRFSKEILLNPNVTKLYMVDAWRHFEKYDDIANCSDSLHSLKMLSALENTQEFKHRRCLINELSVNASEIFPDEFFDFIYLDANHSYEGVLEDLAAWFPKLKAHASIISGDDYLTEVNQFADFGVKKAVDEFFSDQAEVLEAEGEMKQWLVKY